RALLYSKNLRTNSIWNSLQPGRSVQERCYFTIGQERGRNVASFTDCRIDDLRKCVSLLGVNLKWCSLGSRLAAFRTSRRVAKLGATYQTSRTNSQRRIDAKHGGTLSTGSWSELRLQDDRTQSFS